MTWRELLSAVCMFVGILIGLSINDLNRSGFCWLRLRRHDWEWRPGLHRLFEYRRCRRCQWFGGMKPLEFKGFDDDGA